MAVFAEEVMFFKTAQKVKSPIKMLPPQYFPPYMAVPSWQSWSAIFAQNSYFGFTS